MGYLNPTACYPLLVPLNISVALDVLGELSLNLTFDLSVDGLWYLNRGTLFRILCKVFTFSSRFIDFIERRCSCLFPSGFIELNLVFDRFWLFVRIDVLRSCLQPRLPSLLCYYPLTFIRSSVIADIFFYTLYWSSWDILYILEWAFLWFLFIIFN